MKSMNAVLQSTICSFIWTHIRVTKQLFSYFMEHKNRRVAALKEYAKYYGPLTIDTADDEASESFLWVETPWPWEGGGC